MDKANKGMQDWTNVIITSPDDVPVSPSHTRYTDWIELDWWTDGHVEFIGIRRPWWRVSRALGVEGLKGHINLVKYLLRFMSNSDIGLLLYHHVNVAFLTQRTLKILPFESRINFIIGLTYSLTWSNLRRTSWYLCIVNIVTYRIFVIIIK